MAEADFSGWATRNDIQCSDGRTIRHGAFEHQDQKKVPLVWQHQHKEPINTIGYAILEHRDEGVYAYGFFNETDYGKHSKELVAHGDVNSLSIFANQLTQQGKNVMHGNITEVSLVLSGANPGAYIENVNIQHGDSIDVVPDEAIIYSGVEQDLNDLEHSDILTDEVLDPELMDELEEGEEGDERELVIDEVMETLDDDQKQVVHYMIGEALAHAAGSTQEGSTAVADTKEKSVADVFNEMTDDQKQVVFFMIGQALEDAQGDDTAEHGDLDTGAIIGEISGEIIKHMEDSGMSRNVFDRTDEGGKGGVQAPTLSHSQIETIFTDAQKLGSIKDSFLQHAAEYGIENIDILFPDAQTLNNSPEIIGRRTEWVNDVIGGTKHSPFARVKSTAVDLTADQARAKGYVKGNLKKEEIIKLLKRVTTPTTIYKKQKLDRDDIVDITTLDVVAWLKAEMRVMLDEELARAVLIGDGRDADDEDKIDEDHLRPIAYDDDMYSHKVTIGNDLTGESIVNAILRARRFYKGTGTPTMYTTDAVLTDLILQNDKVGRRLYPTETELAAALRVDKIVTVEVMDDAPEILAIIVNLADYTLGADRGGEVSLFDDFDIDYNQYKYLIETRVSGTLTKPKSALVIKRTIGTSVTPQTPSYNGQTHVISLPSQQGVIWSVEGTDKTGNVTITETSDVEARPAQGYSFPSGTNRNWTYTYTA